MDNVKVTSYAFKSNKCMPLGGEEVKVWIGAYLLEWFK
jgi:hypothetical protein